MHPRFESPKGVPLGNDVDKQKLTVEVVDNHVYFYSGVNDDRCLALLKTIRELDSRLREQHTSRMLSKDYLPTPIWLHIQSPGGFLFPALAVANQLTKIKSPIYSVVEGYAASAGTIISVVCTKRYILKDAFIMIHQLSSSAWGKYEELKDEMHLLDMCMKAIKGIYLEHTKIKAAEIEKLLKRDSWFNAVGSIEKGLVDEVI